MNGRSGVGGRGRRKGGVVPVAGVERITRRTAAKRTVDHVWRRLPVNARDELAVGAGGATKALQEKRGKKFDLLNKLNISAQKLH